MIVVEINNGVRDFPIDEQRLSAAVRLALSHAQVEAGEVSLAVVDDAEMHRLNRRHLNHDCPTDVISFVFDASPRAFDGEIIVSADTARREAERLDWRAHDELLLYVRAWVAAPGRIRRPDRRRPTPDAYDGTPLPGAFRPRSARSIMSEPSRIDAARPACRSTAP